MKAVVFHGVGDIRLERVRDPGLRARTDAIVRLTASAICGTDLHFVRGTLPGLAVGTILGHEGVGIVEAVGREVRNFSPGDRVVIPSTIACGYCSYCRDGYNSQCDNANPNGAQAGTAFYGGPKESGPFQGLQAVFPLGNAVEKNLTIKMGNCNHRAYIPELVELVRTGAIDPAQVLTQTEPLMNAIEAYRSFDLREPGWIKVMLEPAR